MYIELKLCRKLGLHKANKIPLKKLQLDALCRNGKGFSNTKFEFFFFTCQPMTYFSPWFWSIFFYIQLPQGNLALHILFSLHISVVLKRNESNPPSYWKDIEVKSLPYTQIRGFDIDTNWYMGRFDTPIFDLVWFLYNLLEYICDRWVIFPLHMGTLLQLWKHIRMFAVFFLWHPVPCTTNLS